MILALLLDIFLTILHIILILFNMLGWIWPKWRKWHLITMAATLLSWFVLGIWFGWGYCFLTDWHWNIKTSLGETGLPNSFIKYGIDQLTGGNIDTRLVDISTLALFLVAILMTIYVNFIKKYRPDR
jgi:hypothetical protein